MDINSQIAQLEQKNDPESHLQLGKIYAEGPFEVRNYQKAISHFEIAANAGFAEAWFKLGFIYSSTNGVSANNVLARQYFEKAAEQNYGSAFVELGHIYKNGIRVEQNQGYADELFATAKKLLEKECEREHSVAFLYLGIMYKKGQGVAQDYTKACELFEKVADLGNSNGLTILGVMYLQGQGVAQNYTKARELFEKSVELGVSDALTILGVMYLQGQGVAQDYTKARELFEKAAELGDSDALNNLGDMYLQGQGVAQDYTKVRELFEKAADLGNSNALTKLGIMYKNGQGVTQDHTKARELFEKAVELGNCDALNHLGGIYHKGKGVAQDYTKARNFLENAVDLGDSDALSNLGLIYLYGQGVAQDYTKARELFEKAADQGVSEALFHLGGMFYDGQGCAKNHTKAFEYWFKYFKQAPLELYHLRFLPFPLLQAARQCNKFDEGNYSEAFTYLSTSKYQNIPEVSFKLGLMYKFGLGTDINLDKAQQLLSFAASNNHHGAMAHLANIFDVQNKTELAFNWYKQAAKLQDSMGCFAVGLANWLGILNKPNHEQALDLINSAAQNNHALSLLLRSMLALDEFNEGSPIDANLAIEILSNALNIVKAVANPIIDCTNFEIAVPNDIEPWLTYANLIRTASLNPDNFESAPEYIQLLEQVNSSDIPEQNLAKYLLGSFYLSHSKYYAQGIKLLESIDNCLKLKNAPKQIRFNYSKLNKLTHHCSPLTTIKASMKIVGIS